MKMDMEGFIHATVNCKVYKLVKLLLLLIVMVCNCPVNPVMNPNPISSNLPHDTVFHLCLLYFKVQQME